MWSLRDASFKQEVFKYSVCWSSICIGNRIEPVKLCWDIVLGNNEHDIYTCVEFCYDLIISFKDRMIILQTLRVLGINSEKVKFINNGDT
jgi:hypothetical protein